MPKMNLDEGPFSLTQLRLNNFDTEYAFHALCYFIKYKKLDKECIKYIDKMWGKDA